MLPVRLEGQGPFHFPPRQIRSLRVTERTGGVGLGGGEEEIWSHKVPSSIPTPGFETLTQSKQQLMNEPPAPPWGSLSRTQALPSGPNGDLSF